MKVKTMFRKVTSMFFLVFFLVGMSGMLNPAKAQITDTYKHIEYWFAGILISEIWVCNSVPTDCLSEVEINPECQGCPVPHD